MTATETKTEETKVPATKAAPTAEKKPDQPKVKVNPEFRDLLPKKSAKSLNWLKADMKENGCLTPIKVWKETNEVVDGHNRLELAKELGISYRVQLVNFSSKDHVKKWIIDNCHAEQFTRDSWTEAEARRMANEYMEIEQRITDSRKKTTKKKAGKSGKPPAKAAAEKRGRSSKRAADAAAKVTGHKFSPAQLEVYNKLTKKAPDLAKQVDEGKISVGKANELFRERIGNPVKKVVKKKGTKKPAAELPKESEWSESLKAALAAYRDLSKEDRELFSQIAANEGIPF